MGNNYSAENGTNPVLVNVDLGVAVVVMTHSSIMQGFNFGVMGTDHQIKCTANKTVDSPKLLSSVMSLLMVSCDLYVRCSVLYSFAQLIVSFLFC